MSNESSVNNLIQGLSKSDPETYSALVLMAQNLYEVFNTVFPPTPVSSAPVPSVATNLGTITNFIAEIFPSNLRLTWDVLSGAFRYEIRLGSNWDTATPILSTASNVANLDPLQLNLIYGSYTFLIRPLNINGSYGPNSTSVSITITVIPAPIITSTVLANNVLLTWTTPNLQWGIAYYKVFKNGSEIAKLNGNFTISVESVSGTYSYTVKAYDIVGNESNESIAVVANVTNPVDFTVISTVNANYGGTYVNTGEINYGGVDGVIGSVYNETWDNHFITNGWVTINDQISAGYPLYFEPGNTTDGTYKEVFDFGGILTNVNVTVLFDKILLAGTCSVTSSIETSTDNITYAGPFSGPSHFSASVRYARITLTFHDSDHFSAAFITNFKVTADVQFTNDSGQASAVSTDAGGTLVNFNITYLQVNSVVATPLTTNDYRTVVTAITTTGFKVLVFDSTGTRVSVTINWHSRGIV